MKTATLSIEGLNLDRLLQEAGDQDVVFLRTNGEVKFATGYFLDSGHPDYQEHFVKVVLDLVRNYPVDGIHFDYVRYTEAEGSAEKGYGVGYNPETEILITADGRQLIVERADLIDLFLQEKIRPDSRGECSQVRIRLTQTCRYRRHVRSTQFRFTCNLPCDCGIFSGAVSSLMREIGAARPSALAVSPRFSFAPCRQVQSGSLV